VKYDFRIKIIAVLYVLTIVILASRSYQTNSKALSIIKTQFSLQQLYVAKTVAESIEKKFDSFVGGLGLLDEVFDVSNDTSMKSFRNSMTKVYNVFKCTCVDDLAFIDDKGKLRVSVLKPHMEGADYSSRTYFLKAQDAKQNDVIFEHQKGTGVLAGQNVHFIIKPLKSQDGDFYGMVCYKILFNKMVDSFIPYDLSGSKACIISKEGAVLSESSGIAFAAIDKENKRDIDFKALMAELKPGTAYSGDYVSKSGDEYTIVSVPVKIAEQTFSIVIITPEQVFRNLLIPFSREYAINIISVIGILVGVSLLVIFLMSKWNLQLNKVVEERTKNLSESEKKQKIMLATVNEVFWEVDADGRYTSISSGALLILGYSPEEIINTSMFDLMSDESAKEFREKLKMYSKSKKSFANLERINVHRNRKHIILSTNGKPLFDAEGNLEGFRGTDRDITLQKNAEQGLKQYADQLVQIRNSLENKVEERTRELKDAHVKLLRKERASVLGQLSIAVSHELRNPLGVISNAVYYFNMKKDSFEDPNVRENIDIISREIKTANKIITDILNFSRDNTPVRLESNINQLVQEMLLRAATPDKVQVVTVFDEDIPLVAIDPTQVAQIFLNLLENAVDAMDHAGTIWVATRRHEKTIEVIFVDDGPGISENDLENIFEPLFTTRAKGIGLGLAIAKNLAEANNAKISVKSKKGEGAVFIVTFSLNNGG
jgi:PAS domain S-box-containing protein